MPTVRFRPFTDINLQSGAPLRHHGQRKGGASLNEVAFAGLGIAVVAGGALWSAKVFDGVDARWPLEAKTRAEDPEGFERHVFIWTVAAIVGVTLFLAGLVSGL
jgi:hypothetical protein